MIREALRNRFAAVAEVADICAGRVFWLRNERAEDAPCIIFRIVGGESAIGDDSCGQGEIVKAEVEWYAVSEDPEQAVTLQEAVKNVMTGSWTADGVTVQHSRFAALLEDDYLEDGDKAAYLCGCRLEVVYASN